MTLTQIIKKLLPKSLKSSLKDSMGYKTMENRLQNLAHAGFQCTGAIDVGAYHGEWSKGLRAVWSVPLIMVEPQPPCKPFLLSLASSFGANSVHIEQCALSKEAGSVEFLLEETNSRMAPSGNAVGLPAIKVPVKTLREMILQYAEKFNLLKADVQGFELDVLEGAGDLLQQFEVIILEVSVIRIGPVPTFFEVMQYMDLKGFRLYDFLPMYYRPLDNALWQGDAFFVRNDSSLVSSLAWKN
jgi:FkbM family methyltransferase